MQTKHDDLLQYTETFSEIVNKHFPSWMPFSSEAYYELCSFYVQMCKGEIVASVPCFDDISECLKLIEHVQMSGSGKFILTYASIPKDYDVKLIGALKDGVLRRLDKLVNRSVKNIDGEQMPKTEFTFNQDGLDEYAWYVDDGGKIASQGEWSDQALDELAKCCKAWKDEEKILRGRGDKRIIILGYYAHMLFACFPETAKDIDKYLCIYDLMRKSGFLDFSSESRLAKMDNKDKVDRSTDVRDWIRSYEEFVQGKKNTKKG